MPMTRDEKKTKVIDHVGAIQSYLDALRIIARSVEPDRTKCAMDLIIEHAESSRRELADLFDELMEGGR